MMGRFVWTVFCAHVEWICQKVCYIGMAPSFSKFQPPPSKIYRRVATLEQQLPPLNCARVNSKHDIGDASLTRADSSSERLKHLLNVYIYIYICGRDLWGSFRS